MNKTIVFGLVLLGLIAVASGYASFAGANLYYAAGLYQNDQQYLFSNLQAAGVKVLRVWLDGQTSATTKGTNIISFPDLEPKQIGVFDDTVLNLLDGVMINAHSYGIKLLVSMHSFNALQAGDVYGQRWGTGYFYQKADAQAAFDNRLRHVLNHVNQKLGKPWKELNDYIFAFEAENEAMIGKGQQYIQDHQYWQCDRAQTIKTELNGNTGILVTTGGESWVQESIQPDWLTCPYLDVIAVHGYGTGDFDTSYLKSYIQPALNAGKKLLFQEWGACYFDTSNNDCPNGSPLDPSTRNNNIINWGNSISAAGFPWMYWEILPNRDPHYGYDFEIGIDGAYWNAFVTTAKAAASYDTPFNYGPWLLD